MARAVRKKELTAEERLTAALVTEEKQPYNTQEGLNSNPHLKWGCSDFQPPS